MCSSVQLSIADEDTGVFVEKVFKELDINRDNVIDKQDIEKFSEKEFKLIDTNKDSIITKNEFFDFVCTKSCNDGNCECRSYNNKEDLDYLKEYWDRIDTNNDGNISYQEKLNADLDSFYSLDSNNDGKLDKADIEKQLY
jgi:Ca2+-binding EF-hand superfamily protein